MLNLLHALVVLVTCVMVSSFDVGNKVNNIDVVYTPWYNLKKTPSMDVGQVGFHNPKLVSQSYLLFLFPFTL
jgi:hypothetical protein